MEQLPGQSYRMRTDSFVDSSGRVLGRCRRVSQRISLNRVVDRRSITETERDVSSSTLRFGRSCGRLGGVESSSILVTRIVRCIHAGLTRQPIVHTHAYTTKKTRTRAVVASELSRMRRKRRKKNKHNQRTHFRLGDVRR